MTTPSIYTVGQLRAYLQGKRAVLNAPVPLTTEPQEIAVRQAQTALCDEVIALCEGIEAYRAGAISPMQAEQWLDALGRHEAERDKPNHTT